MAMFSKHVRLSSSLLERLKRHVTGGNPGHLLFRSFATTEGHRPSIVHKRSLDILHDPWFNKGTAFSMTERDRLDLRGLLPPNVMSPDLQIERFSMLLYFPRSHANIEDIESMLFGGFRE